MSFFSDLKEDLAMAVNDQRRPEEKTQEEDNRDREEQQPEPETEEAGYTDKFEDVSLEKMLQNIDSIQLPEEMLQQQREEEEKMARLERERGRHTKTSFAEEDETEGPADTAEDAETMENYLKQLNGFLSQQDDGEESAKPLPEQEQEDDASEDGGEFEENPDGSGEEDEEASAEEGEAAQEASEDEAFDEEDAEDFEDSTQDRYKTANRRKEDGKGEDGRMGDFGTKTTPEDTAIITAGMTVVGDISSESSVDVFGSITGNIDVLGRLRVMGSLDGNSKASEVYAEGAKIKGEIVSEGCVDISASTVVIGNITALSADIAGAVKGDIDVKGPVRLDSTAIVMGNIKSKSVQINNGAVIEGMCSQCYADASPTSFFDEFETGKNKNTQKTEQK